MNLLLRPLRSSLGKKYLIAVTGLLLIGFVIGHAVGNLLIFAGPDALNGYAQALKARPALLWSARLGLLFVFGLHLVYALRVSLENKAARPQRYVYEDTLEASFASRHMLLTGLVLLAFIVYHLAHFTLGVVSKADVQVVEAGRVEKDVDKNYLDLAEIRKDGGKVYVPVPDQNLGSITGKETDARHDVYSMVVSGFRKPWITLTYLVAMAFLGLHLWHGGSSFLQTLGLNGARYKNLVRVVGPVLAVVVVAANCSIPLAVWLQIIK